MGNHLPGPWEFRVSHRECDEQPTVYASDGGCVRRADNGRKQASYHY